MLPISKSTTEKVVEPSKTEKVISFLLTLNNFTMWLIFFLLQLKEGAIDLFSKTVKDNGLAIDLNVA